MSEMSSAWPKPFVVLFSVPLLPEAATSPEDEQDSGSAGVTRRASGDRPSNTEGATRITRVEQETTDDE